MRLGILAYSFCHDMRYAIVWGSRNWHIHSVSVCGTLTHSFRQIRDRSFYGVRGTGILFSSWYEICLCMRLRKLEYIPFVTIRDMPLYEARDTGIFLSSRYEIGLCMWFCAVAYSFRHDTRYAFYMMFGILAYSFRHDRYPFVLGTIQWHIFYHDTR